MRINKLYIAIGMIVAFCMFFELAAHADEANQETIITFSAPVQIPGRVLPAGTYRFQLADPNGDQQVVSIFNADGTVLYSMLQTIPTDRPDARSGDTTVTLARAEGGNSVVLVNSFYPGESTGHEFVYPKQQERQIAHAAHVTFKGNQSAAGGFAGGN